jgi:hypothetical protein
MPRSTLPAEISAPDYQSLIWEHLTPEVCDEVFQLTRDKERQRKWGLHALLKTWIGLLQEDLHSQTHAVEEYCGKGHPLFPLVEASPESFFKRIQSLRPEFFRSIFSRFNGRIESDLPPHFQRHLGIAEDLFPEVYALDASRLDKVGRVLKVARKTTKAIIPGSIEAVYDLRRGHVRELWFDPDGARSEMAMFEMVLGSIAAGSLIVNDRYYSKPVMWRKVDDAGIAMVSRYNATVKKKKIKTLSRVRTKSIAIDDWLVEMGGSQYGEDPVVLRWVHIRAGHVNIILLTNVTDPKILSVEQLQALYRQRWSIERMYLHLKEVLHLNRLFNAHPSAVGQQVFATAILYNALRLSQSQMAWKLGVDPERFSPDKLFPRLIRKIVEVTFGMCFAEKVVDANSHLKDQLIVPKLEVPDLPILKLSLKGLWVEKRSDHRIKRRFCKGRKTWTTYRKIPGASHLLQN